MLRMMLLRVMRCRMDNDVEGDEDEDGDAEEDEDGDDNAEDLVEE